jgi:hypothetical protein
MCQNYLYETFKSTRLVGGFLSYAKLLAANPDRYWMFIKAIQKCVTMKAIDILIYDLVESRM